VNDVVLASWRIDFGDDDFLVYNTADGRADRYGEASALSLATFGMTFGGAVMITDPRTLTLVPFTNQDMPLDEILDQPGFVVMVDVGPATAPASALVLGSNDLHTPTPQLTATPTATASAPVVGTSTVAPTATGQVPASPSPTGSGGGTPTRPVTGPSPTPTETPETLPCRGDCNGNGEVSVDELVRAVNVALDLLAVDTCPPADADDSGAITINELIVAVSNALDGCGGD
jgi:hypothetical protein